MRADVQEIFKLTPHEKQVMMFSATLGTDMRAICKKFLTNVRSTLQHLPCSPVLFWVAPACSISASCGQLASAHTVTHGCT